MNEPFTKIQFEDCNRCCKVDFRLSAVLRIVGRTNEDAESRLWHFSS